MMSNIKDRKRRNDDDELWEHSQNAKIVIRQESDAIFEKTIQSETKNDNEKIFSHEFSKNDTVNYIALVKKERTRNKNLKIKREYQILLKKNKKLHFSFRNDEISVSIKRKRNADRANNDSFNETSQFKRQRSIVKLKSANLNLYYDKNYKEFKDWTRNALNAFEINSFYFFNKWKKICWAQQYMRKTSSQRWNNYKKKNLKTAITIWFWKNFFKFLFNLIKNSKNQQLIAVQKYDFVR